MTRHHRCLTIRPGEVATFAALLAILVYVAYTISQAAGVSSGALRARDITSRHTSLDYGRTSDRVRSPQIPSGTRCIDTKAGDDIIIIDEGILVVRPGTGNDTVETRGRTRAILIEYESGNDIYHLPAGEAAIDLKRYNRDRVSFVISGNDLNIVTPAGTIRIKNHFVHRHLDIVRLRDTSIVGEQLFAAAIDDAVALDPDQVHATPQADMILLPMTARHFDAAAGNDVLRYRGGTMIILPGPGKDKLAIELETGIPPGFSIAPNLRDLLIKTGPYTLTVAGQFDPSDLNAGLSEITFSGQRLDAGNLHLRAISEQSTPADDLIRGTDLDDTFEPMAGNDTIVPGQGSDLIVFSEGHDRVKARVETRKDSDTLSMTNWSRKEMGFKWDGVDLIITDPHGNTLCLERQFVARNVDVAPNIEQFRFSDEIVDYASIERLYPPR